MAQFVTKIQKECKAEDAYQVMHKWRVFAVLIESGIKGHNIQEPLRMKPRLRPSNGIVQLLVPEIVQIQHLIIDFTLRVYILFVVLHSREVLLSLFLHVEALTPALLFILQNFLEAFAVSSYALLLHVPRKLIVLLPDNKCILISLEGFLNEANEAHYVRLITTNLIY